MKPQPPPPPWQPGEVPTVPFPLMPPPALKAGAAALRARYRFQSEEELLTAVAVAETRDQLLTIWGDVHNDRLGFAGNRGYLKSMILVRADTLGVSMPVKQRSGPGNFRRK